MHASLDHADRVSYEKVVTGETAPKSNTEEALRRRVAELEGALTSMTEALLTRP